MNADFHYRDKIAVAVIGLETEMGRQLINELATHPWFILAQKDEPIGLTIVCRGHSEATPRIVDGAGQVIVPEVNAEQISVEPLIVGLASAPTAALAIALKPLQKAFGIKAVHSVVISGPGFGPNNARTDSALADRMMSEIKEVLALSSEVHCSIDAIGVPLSQQTVQCVSVTCEEPTSCEALKTVWKEAHNELASLHLSSVRGRTVRFWDDPQGPPVIQGQVPALDVHISRLQICPIFGYKFVVTSNASRTGILLLAEMLVKTGKVYW